MTNYEYYRTAIERLTRLGIRPTINLDGKIISCDCLQCSECLLSDTTLKECTENLIEWAYQPYSGDLINWNKVAVDTKIYVRLTEDEEWCPRYFAKYEDGEVYAWNNGKTSFTTEDSSWWKYAKLAEPFDGRS